MSWLKWYTPILNGIFHSGVFAYHLHKPWTRLLVVSNVGDGVHGAGEKYTRERAKFWGEAMPGERSPHFWCSSHVASSRNFVHARVYFCPPHDLYHQN